MLNDNQNNFHWKNKLEDVDSLFGETLPDKNNAWEKLHARLHEEPRRKGFAWYWVAAACLLLAVIIPVITMNKKQDDIVKNDIEKIEPEQKTIPQISTLKENEALTIAPVVNENKRLIKIPTGNKEITSVGNNITVNNETAVTNSNDKTTEQQPIISATPFVDSATVTALAVIPQKKKIKVVHVNELGEVVEVSPDIARITDIHAFQLKLATQEVYKTPSVASNTTGITFKKKPPSN